MNTIGLVSNLYSYSKRFILQFISEEWTIDILTEAIPNVVSYVREMETGSKNTIINIEVRLPQNNRFYFNPKQMNELRAGNSKEDFMRVDVWMLGKSF